MVTRSSASVEAASSIVTSSVFGSTSPSSASASEASRRLRVISQSGGAFGSNTSATAPTPKSGRNQRSPGLV
jgi:hypothetical protein